MNLVLQLLGLALCIFALCTIVASRSYWAKLMEADRQWIKLDDNPPRGVDPNKVEYACCWRLKPEPTKPREFWLNGAKIYNHEPEHGLLLGNWSVGPEVIHVCEVLPETK